MWLTIIFVFRTAGRYPGLDVCASPTDTSQNLDRIREMAGAPQPTYGTTRYVEELGHLVDFEKQRLAVCCPGRRPVQIRFTIRVTLVVTLPVYST